MADAAQNALLEALGKLGAVGAAEKALNDQSRDSEAAIRAAEVELKGVVAAEDQKVSDKQAALDAAKEDFAAFQDEIFNQYGVKLALGDSVGARTAL